MHEIEEDKEFIICKCDNCGIEFDGYDWNQNMYYAEGEFGAGTYNSEYGEGVTYNLHKDLCRDCMSKFINHLNKKLDEISCKDYIFSQLEDLKNIR